MTMALKADVAAACKRNGSSKPVDLVHLSIQTMGDRKLERQVLEIFLSQSRNYLSAFHDAADDDARMRAAHSLKGAARGIGAWELAEIASLAEEEGGPAYPRLRAETERVCAYIADLGSD